jgi:hypothetical protein
MGLNSILLAALVGLFIQNPQISLEKLQFKSLPFRTSKDKVIATFGKPKIVETSYECGFHATGQANGPYYQLAYDGFNYIGSDKEEFILEKVVFDLKGVIKLKYGGKELNGLITKTDFAKIFGDAVRRYLDEHPKDDLILLLSSDGEDGARFIFKGGKLFTFEYWSPC